jgi:hypothetical protein
MRESVMKQWYDKNTEWLQLEIEAMNKIYPKAKNGFLNDGRMYWTIPIETPFRNWVLLAVYDSDYKDDGSGSVCKIKFYPLEPTYEKLKELVENARVQPGIIPHTYCDNNGNVCLDIMPPQTVKDMRSEYDTVVNWITYAIRWFMYFDAGMHDEEMWNRFCGQ